MEVCVDNVVSALNAAKGGAKRLELCSALSEGGLTPSVGMLQVIKSQVSIPVFVMLRPRAGVDFVYSALEIEVLVRDAQLLKDAGADGFVFGALTEEGHIDQIVCKQVLEVCFPHPVTFHRAFDLCADVKEALEIIIQLGFCRILTSGQESSAEKGMAVLKDIIIQAKGRIRIMPGAGITKSNLKYILENTGVDEFHASAKTVITKTCFRNTKCAIGANDNIEINITSENLVREMVDIVESLTNSHVEC